MPHIVSGKKDTNARPTESSVAAWKSILVDDGNHKDWKHIMDQYKTNSESAITQVVIGDKNLPLTPVIAEKKAMNIK